MSRHRTHARTRGHAGRTEVLAVPPHARRPELSQHFLRDPRLARAIVGELRPAPGAIVLDAGAGPGALTAPLADMGFRVIAVEKDVRLFRSVRARFIGRTNVECHHADVLEFVWPRETRAVVSNVPYAITAALVRQIIASRADEAVLIVQREAAEKFAGTPRETMFSLLHKPRYDITIARRLRRCDFAPPPSVESAVLVMRRRPSPLLRPDEAAAWRVFVQRGFGAATVRDVVRDTRAAREIVRLERELGFGRAWRPSWLTFAQWLALFDRCTPAANLRATTRGASSRARAGTRHG
jgi:23S rRNA (adenine-N6)-dimethyltransferase